MDNKINDLMGKAQDLFEKNKGKGAKLPDEIRDLIAKHEKGSISLDELKKKAGSDYHEVLDAIHKLKK